MRTVHKGIMHAQARPPYLLEHTMALASARHGTRARILMTAITAAAYWWMLQPCFASLCMALVNAYGPLRK